MTASPPASAAPTSSATIGGGRTVALFATCLVEMFRPTVALAAVKLIEAAGFRVAVPAAQTCCGQPNYNAGDREGAKTVARAFVAAFRGFDFIVAPSGSCAAMARLHIPKLLADDPLASAASETAARTFELVQFLHDRLDAESSVTRARGGADTAVHAVTYHDSCSGLRELGIKAAPRVLLDRAGVRVAENAGAETCCGFGGAFCVKYPAIAERIADDKIAQLVSAGAPLVLGGDLGCLLHLAGRIGRTGGALRCRHVAEVLAGETAGPAIGEAAPDTRS